MAAAALLSDSTKDTPWQCLEKFGLVFLQEGWVPGPLCPGM